MLQKGEGLSGLIALDVHCEDCGRRRRIGKRRLTELVLRGYTSIEQVGDRLRCSPCTDRGAHARNISVLPRYQASKSLPPRLSQAGQAACPA